MVSTTEDGLTRIGGRRLERHWPAAGARAAVLLVHGINEHSGRYEHVGAYLADHGLDTLAFDLRGHGASEGRRGHIDTFADFLDDIEDLLAVRRQAGLPVILLGHSLGGLICTTYAASDRPQPDLLVLSAPALQTDVLPVLRRLAPLVARLAPHWRLPNTIDGALLSRDEAVGTAYRDDPLRVTHASARLGAEIFVTMAATQANLDRIRIPTYVIHGSEDRLVLPESSAGFAALPNATRVVHEGLRHECFNEPEQEEVLAGVVAWVDAQLR